MARRSVATPASPKAATNAFTWAAVVYRTPVNDDDHDGLLNLWETSTDPIPDPYGRALPMLSKMGADPNAKDIFMEVHFMKTDIARNYGAE